MREITSIEAEIICGAHGVPGAIAGAAVAATGYIGASVGGGTFKTGDFIGATVTGAVTGAIMGPAGISRMIGGTLGGYGAGVIGGSISREMNAA